MFMTVARTPSSACRPSRPRAPSWRRTGWRRGETRILLLHHHHQQQQQRHHRHRHYRVPLGDEKTRGGRGGGARVRPPPTPAAPVVQFWNDYAQFQLPPRNLRLISGLHKSVAKFDCYSQGYDLLASTEDQEQYTDDLRRLLEAADSPMGVQMFVDVDSGFGGLAEKYLQVFRDDYPRTPVLVWGIGDSRRGGGEGAEKKWRNELNFALGAARLGSLSSLFIPVVNPTYTPPRRHETPPGYPPVRPPQPLPRHCPPLHRHQHRTPPSPPPLPLLPPLHSNHHTPRPSNPHSHPSLRRQNRRSLPPLPPRGLPGLVAPPTTPNIPGFGPGSPGEEEGGGDAAWTVGEGRDECCERVVTRVSEGVDVDVDVDVG